MIWTNYNCWPALSLGDIDYGFICISQYPILSYLPLLTLVFSIFFNTSVVFFQLINDKMNGMSNYRFTVLIRQDMSLYYFKTNATLYRIGT